MPNTAEMLGKRTLSVIECKKYSIYRNNEREREIMCALGFDFY